MPNQEEKISSQADTDTIVMSLSSQVMQDYAYTDKPAPLAVQEGDLVTIKDGLVVIQESRLVLYEPQTTSASGWRVSEIDVPRPPTAANDLILAVKSFRVHGEVDGKGTSTTNLLCLFAASGWAKGGDAEAGYAVSWLQRVDGESAWVDANVGFDAAAMLSEVAQIDVVDSVTSGVFVYGVIPNFMNNANARYFALRLEDYTQITRSAWSLATFEDCPMRDDLTDFPRLTFLTAGASQATRLCLCVAKKNNLYWTQQQVAVSATFGPAITNLSYVDTAAPTFSSFFPVTGQQDWTAFGVTGSEAGGQVTKYVLFPDGSHIAPVLNTGTDGSSYPQSVSSIAFSYRPNATIGLFALAGGRLWLLRDTEAFNWVQLNNVAYAIATPATEVLADEVFFAGGLDATACDIQHLSQDTSGSVWVQQDFKIPRLPSAIAGDADAPNDISSVTVELAVTRASKKPLRAKPNITAESDQWVVLRTGGYAYWVGPGRPANFPTDSLGKSSISFEAVDLKFPHLQFTASTETADGTQMSVAGGCQGDVIDHAMPFSTSVASRLAGSGNDNHFQMNTDNLTSANLVPQDSSSSKVTDKLRQIGVWMNNKNKANGGGSVAAAAPSAAWRLSVDPSGAMTCVDLTDAEAAALFDLGSVESVAGDVLNFVKHEVETFGDWSICVGTDVIHIAVAGVKAVIRTVREAGDLVGTFLASIRKIAMEVVAFIKEIVAFLRMLLDFESYIRTHKALRAIFEWALSYGEARLTTTVTSYAKQKIGDASGEVEGLIASIKTFLVGQAGGTTNTYGQTLPSQSTRPGCSTNSKPVLEGNCYNRHLSNHQPRCMYVFNAAKHIGLPSAAMSSSTDGSGSFNAMKGTLNEQWNTPDHQAKLLAARNYAMTNNIDGNSLLDTAMEKIFRMLEDLLKAAFEGTELAVEAILLAAADAIKVFQDVFNHKWDIPIISWLYKTIAHEDLTALNLICLAMAVPVTIMFDSVEQREPFSEGQPDIVQGAFPKNGGAIDFSAFSPSAAAPQALPGAPSSSASLTYEDFATSIGLVAAFIDVIGGIFTIAGDGLAMANAVEGNTEPDFATTLVSWESWLCSAMGLVASAPFGIFKDGVSSASDGVYVAYWASNGIPTAYDLVALCATEEQMKMIGGIGAVAEAFAGLAIAVLGGIYVTYAVKEKSGGAWDYTNVILTSVPRPIRGLIALLTDDPDPIAVGIIATLVIGADAVGMYGGTATQIGATLRG